MGTLTMHDWRRQAASNEIEKGATFRFSRTFTADDVDVFGHVTRDDNPVHRESKWCEAKGFRRPICHGLLVGSMLCEPGGQVGWLATAMRFKFLKPTYIGDTVTCEMTIIALDERGFARAEATLTNQSGDVVIAAELEGFLPAANEQGLLLSLIERSD